MDKTFTVQLTDQDLWLLDEALTSLLFDTEYRELHNRTVQDVERLKHHLIDASLRTDNRPHTSPWGCKPWAK